MEGGDVTSYYNIITKILKFPYPFSIICGLRKDSGQPEETGRQLVYRWSRIWSRESRPTI